MGSDKDKPNMRDRIVSAFRDGEHTLSFHELARRLYPDDKSWRYQKNGGPPGCYMALSAAIRRHGIGEIYVGPHKVRYVVCPQAQ